MNDERKAVALLRRAAILAGAPPAALVRLAQRTEIVAARRRRVIYMPGDPGAWVYFIQSGRVKVSKVTTDGKEVTVAVRGEGDLFGELALLDGSPREEMAEVTEHAVIGQLDRRTFQELVQQNARLGWRMTRMLCERLRELQTRVQFLLFKDVQSKLAALLVQLCDDHGETDARGTSIGVKITHQEMANLIGSTRETVSLTLSEFRKAGLVHLDGRKITVVDRQGLESASR